MDPPPFTPEQLTWLQGNFRRQLEEEPLASLATVQNVSSGTELVNSGTLLLDGGEHDLS